MVELLMEVNNLIVVLHLYHAKFCQAISSYKNIVKSIMLV